MSLILGKEYCKVDSNGRFKFPIALKMQLETDDVRFVIRDSNYAECLELWTYASFTAEVEKLQRQLNPYSIKDRELLRKFSEGNIVELDSNDRLVIPPEQKTQLKDAKDIVLQSLGNFIEVWDRNTYQRMNDQPTDFASMADTRLGSLPADDKAAKD
jgi:MraZ protein